MTDADYRLHADLDLAAEIMVPAVYRVVAPTVTAAQQLGPLPPVTSEAFLTAEPVQQLAAVLVLGLAYVMHGDPGKAALRQAGHDVHGGDTDYWRRVAEHHVTHEELERRRAELGSMAGGDAA